MPIRMGVSVLLVVEEARWSEARRRRDPEFEALVPEEYVIDPEWEAHLWTAMGCDPGAFSFGEARYHRVCLVAPPGSRLLDQGAALFVQAMRPLVARGGLFGCDPPFDRKRARRITVSEAQAAARRLGQ